MTFLTGCKRNMDVENSNRYNEGSSEYTKTNAIVVFNKSFTMDIYFIWFSALIFITEIVIDLCLATYYTQQREIQLGLTTLAIIILPLIICQLSSLLMFWKQGKMEAKLLLVHILLMAIPYRYHNILTIADKKKTSILEVDSIKCMIQHINILQAINAIFQYFPQCCFQVFLIIYWKYQCVIIGISAGLAGFSFLWHIFIHLYYCKNNRLEVSTTLRNVCRHNQQQEHNRKSNFQDQTRTVKILGNNRITDKMMCSPNHANLVSKNESLENVEANKILDFTKRKTKYEEDFFRTHKVDESLYIASSNIHGQKTEEFNNENNINHSFSYIKPNCFKDIDETLKVRMNNSSNVLPNNLLKRKGICSSIEMLHLVDFINGIPSEHVDNLAKSVAEICGEDSENFEQECCTKLLFQFPEEIDEQTMETVDAAIYENQIIFQERIKKNKLTIQNLKLQDLLLSKYLEEVKYLPTTEMVNVRYYENMCFANVNRQNRLAHWRNYVQGIDTSIHDNSTIQNISSYVNTISNSATDYYIDENSTDFFVNGDRKLFEKINLSFSNTKSDWCEIEGTLKAPYEHNDATSNLFDSTESNYCLPRKNILVETINAINL